MPMLNVGDIFLQTEKSQGKFINKYWKVTCVHNWGNDTRPEWHYSTIKCNKAGKEFRCHGSFSCNIDRNFVANPVIPLTTYYTIYSIVSRGNEVGNKANIANGVLVGKLKRRKSFLQARIISDTKEIEKITNELLTLN